MCKWGTSVILRLTIPADLSHSGREYEKAIGIDQCIAPLVEALNAGGVRMRASCCGHGHGLGSITLADGRELIIAPSAALACQIVNRWARPLSGGGTDGWARRLQPSRPPGLASYQARSAGSKWVGLVETCAALGDVLVNSIPDDLTYRTAVHLALCMNRRTCQWKWSIRQEAGGYRIKRAGVWSVVPDDLEEWAKSG